ncbi:MAG: phosphatidylserine decarboxylase [Sinobacterium sp.]|nr:phosphatidylserine decarboxylase [Sinobacterium sp.]
MALLPEKAFTTLQKFIPQHLLSRLVGKFAASENKVIKNTFITWFVKQYQVDLSEAKIETANGFASFNDFFTRELKEGRREISQAANTIASPADGAISELGKIEFGRLMQAKGQYYSLTQLLAGNTEQCNRYTGGDFATIYLSPKDYHRVHMPIDGTLKSMTYVPGDLFSVNQATANHIPGLFARNERLVCEFSSQNGDFIMILVGAMIVAGIETVWAGHVAPVKPELKTTDFSNLSSIELKKGDEMGRFKLGSTVILLFQEKTVGFTETLANGSALRMGEEIGVID